MQDRSALSGKVALITGAGSGIGRATVELFAEQGARVIALGRDLSELQELKSSIKDSEIMTIVADISKPADMEKAVTRIVDNWGRLDIVVANAGINGVWAPIDELSPDEFRHTIDVNLIGTFLTLKYSVPLLRLQGGSIVIISSIIGTRVFSSLGATAYSCSKAAQAAMAKILAVELAQHRIRVNVICPGSIKIEIDENENKSDLQPVDYPEGSIPLTGGEPGISSQVANLCLFLAADMSDHITGTEVWIDGGQSLVQG